MLAAVYEDDGEAVIVLTRRSAALRAHSGEVSFPGGGQDAGEDLRDTALREACEEVGLDPSLVEFIGELDHLSTITSNSFIIPFVAVLSAPPELVASPAEVAAVLRVPLRELLDPAHFREEVWNLFGTDSGDVVLRAGGRHRVGRHRLDAGPAARLRHRHGRAGQPRAAGSWATVRPVGRVGRSGRGRR